MVLDASSPAVKRVDHLAASNLCRSNETFEGLGPAIGVDEKTFVETIGKYNADAAAGGDTVFGAPKDCMTPVLKVPFYAARITAVNTIANAEPQSEGASRPAWARPPGG